MIKIIATYVYSTEKDIYMHSFFSLIYVNRIYTYPYIYGYTIYMHERFNQRVSRVYISLFPHITSFLVVIPGMLYRDIVI